MHASRSDHQCLRFVAAAATAVIIAACTMACARPAEAMTAPQTDVMFVFDTSGSMGPVLDEAKAEVNG
jgi:hypothetical protein